MKGLRLVYEKGQNVTKNSWKKLEGIILPEFYKKVASVMQDSQRSPQSLQKSTNTIIIDQRVMMHLDHPNNSHYVRAHKGVYHRQGLGCVSTQRYTKSCILF